MPEIKNAFIQGKMNKDLDERLIPNGEYRDALNVDVDFSDGSSVGALKNIKGTTQKDSISLSSATCIGNVKDTENSKIYWFITSSAKDLISEWNYSTNAYDTILVDSGSVLNFNTNNLITGANVIDGILYFTDNLNEPRQVDIEYWRSQTSGSTGTSTGLTAERITVIKKSPLAAPTLSMSSSTRGGTGTAGGNTVTCSIDLSASAGSDLQNAKDAGATVSGTFSADPNYQANDIIIFSFDFSASDGEITKTEARIKMASNYDGGTGFSGAEILTISKQVRGAAVAYTCLLQEDDPLFERKFPRFSYRYKYNNGQYSCLAPFSNPAFLPDSTVGSGTGFEYNAEDGYNKSMVNTLRTLTLQNLDSNVHADVDEIDIIYRESVGTNVYIVDTIKRQSNGSLATTFEVKDEQIFKVLPSNQLLRLFDSVPKKAKSQDVSANRLIYGNYTHQFDLPVAPVAFDVGLRNRYDPTDSNRNERQSIKSNRTYQIGVVYMDLYGRQTPVLTDKTGIIKVPQGQAKNMTQLTAKITTSAPAFATNYRYFIKEISSLQYNLCADSFYQDDQGYVYVSFPSAEINKVDIDDILILKKKTGNDPSDITDKFKVLDKLTTPPQFLAKPLREYYTPTTFTFSKDYEQDHDQTTIKPGSTPVPDRNRVTIRDMHNKGELKVASASATMGSSDRGVSKDAFSAVSTGKKVKFICGDTESKVYEIKSRELNLSDDDDIELHFTEEFGTDVIGLYEDYVANPLTTALRPGVKLVGVKEEDESGKAEFEGRFFLKLKADTNLIAELKGSVTNTENLTAISTISLDGDKADNDPRALHVFTGGNAGENTSSSTVRDAAPTAGGWTSPNSNASATGTPGWQNSAHGSVLAANPYHFSIRTDKSYGDADSDYGAHPFLQNLKAGNFLKFDNTATADTNYYKIERVYQYDENYDSSTRRVYGVGLDTNLSQTLRRQGDDGDANTMQMTVYEIDSEDLVNIVNPPIFETEPQDDVDIDLYYETQENMTVSSNHGNNNLLSYYNCISFENGVEGVTIRDDFNSPPVGKGVRVSTIFEDNYQEEAVTNGLIFSQIYNGKTNVNRFNQFIIAEDITKRLNPEYGSIQLLHTRYNDIIAYCENKVIKILTNKDALFNADGSTNVTSNKAVLGQSMPYSSNYGIGTNPESFDDFLFRSYFVDAKSGAVVRHSMDGMEAISNYGMKDYFRDNLNLQSGYIHGSYDVVKSQYNISLPTTVNTTVSFSEPINGWCSRKSYVNEGGVSVNNKYFTFKNGHIYENHVGTRNTFYGAATTPFVEFIFNEAPANMKNFRTLNYEGDSGWTCASIVTDQQDGAVASFVEKENKYFNYISGVTENASTIDLKALNVQGIGVYSSVSTSGGDHITYNFANNTPQDLQKADTLYYVHPTGDVITEIGTITAVTATSVTGRYSSAPPTSGSPYFVFYSKNAKWQTSGLLGYHATVKMQNTSTDSKEIYSVGSEISISS